MPTPAEHGTAHAWSWHHAGLVVDDLDRATQFYREALGFEIEFLVRDMDDQFQRTVGVPGVVCDLAQLIAPSSATRVELIEVRGVPEGLDPRLPVHVGVGHGAYQVRDLEASIAGLVASGGAQLGEIVQFAEGRAVYCWSAAGTVVELEEAE
ncbi:VOC family protein [Pseudolysinimonas sp.]|jgi:catechol 2,3-dioxygenase-like lactoylglutathione lyase family enzyme|uniref:VOC family protein n=1 Tax=Pseudolysinimonas sp. TaxID=2680009 RepID=UPI0037841FDF